MKFSTFLATFVLSTTVINAPLFGLTQSLPRPNRQGDYQQFSKRWRVVSSSLNCRQVPGSNSPAIMQFSKRAIIVKYDDPHSESIDGTERDEQGNPWVPIEYRRATDLDHFRPCYVRANSRYIRPVSN